MYLFKKKLIFDQFVVNHETRNLEINYPLIMTIISFTKLTIVDIHYCATNVFINMYT